MSVSLEVVCNGCAGASVPDIRFHLHLSSAQLDRKSVVGPLDTVLKRLENILPK